MNFTRRLLLSILPLLIIIFANAQTRKITGKVTGPNNEPLEGVNVQAKGLNNFVTTSADGSFAIEVPGKVKTLVFSYTSMESEEANIAQNTNVQIQLRPSKNPLSDVVVIGYGTQRRKEVTGAVASIPGDKIAERPVSTFDQALQGLAPGLQIAQRNASPGELSTINIRGIGSLSAGFQPLFVVDGFPTDQRNATAINPMDIQSIEILKDASSTAIYGSRGANGVIIITTKSGSRGKSVVDVNLSGGIAKVNKKDLYDAANGAEYVQYYKEYYTNLGLTTPAAIANWDGTNTNWQNLIYQTAAFQDYSVSVRGGDQKVSYLFSGGYISQPGTIIGEGFDKYSARIKVDYKATSFLTLGLNIAPNFETSKRSSPRESDWGSLQSMATLLPPIVPVRKANGSYATMQDVLPGVLGNVGNPLQVAENWKQTDQSFLSLFNTYAQLKIIEDCPRRRRFIQQ
jgi:TonB-linked SusC/RagA family outer membrane protein